MKNSSGPLDSRISAIIPTLGRPSSIEKCFSSIRRQFLPVQEVIVVHCGADRVTQQLCEAFSSDGTTHFRYYHFAEANAAAQRNFGVRMATYDNLMFLDDD